MMSCCRAMVIISPHRAGLNPADGAMSLSPRTTRPPRAGFDEDMSCLLTVRPIF